MNRRKKLYFNTVISVVYQIVAIVCGFILPKLFITYYGSEINGLVSSVTQYLGFITLAECGVGAVTQSALYKPLAEKDNLQISKIMASAKRFYRRCGYILVGYVAVLLVVFPLVINRNYDWWFTASLILAISISSFAQYYFSMAYRMLLTADQLGFIQIGLQIITLILNTLFAFILVKLGCSIQIVKLVTSLIFLLQPLCLEIVVRKYYKLDRKVKLTEEPLKQKWNGLAQHVAAVVLGNTDVVILSFVSLISVSIYHVYYLVVSGLHKIVNSLTGGIQALLGNMYAKGEDALLHKTFSLFEWGMHTIITFLFVCAGILMIPFVKVYTQGVTDADYVVPVFSALIVLAYAFFSMRFPYTVMILVAGHYKETQWSCIIEAGLNVILSIIFVIFWGLSGVALGTLIAMIYRTLYCVFYLQKHILKRPCWHYFKNLAVDILTAGLCIVATIWIKFEEVSWLSWIIMALKVAGISLVVVAVVNCIFYFKNIKELVGYMRKKIWKKKK